MRLRINKYIVRHLREKRYVFLLQYFSIELENIQYSLNIYNQLHATTTTQFNSYCHFAT